MSFADDDAPKKKLSHEIGCDLSLLSADELTARIAALQAEISRLEAERTSKVKGRAAAEGLFRLT